jgi:glycosyltransferase involved in cell wall biosynthesis
LKDKKLRILHVHDVAFVGSTLVSGLREIGAEAFFYELINLKKNKFPKPIELIIIFLLRIFEIFRFGYFIRNNKFNVIHIHYGLFSYLPLVNRVPYFLHTHGSDVKVYLNSPIYGPIIKLGIKKAIAVFYSTPGQKTIVEAIRSDAIFFPNSVDIEVFNNKNIFSVINQRKTIFHINKLDRFKGIEKTLIAMEKLLEIETDLRLMMFGFGNAKYLANNFLRMYQNDPRIQLINNRVSHEEMVNLINNADIVIGGLETGSLGCSELEAMACSKPVICNFKYPHLYKSPPPLCNAESVNEIVDHTIHLLNDGEYSKTIGIQANLWIKENLEKKSVAQKLLQIYNEYNQ